MLAKTRGIVLNQIKYSETSIIVYMYTEDFGRQNYLIKGAKRKKAKIKANIFQPFFLLDLEVYNKPNRNFQNIKEVQISAVYESISTNILKNTISIFITEVLYKLIKEEEANSLLFEFLYNSAIYLDKLKENIINYHLFFLIELTQYIGFLPDNNYSAHNVFFDFMKGQFVTNSPDHGYYLDQSLSRILHFILNGNNDNCAIPLINNKLRIKFLEGMIEYYQFHLEGFSNINSLEVFKELFH